MPIELTWVAAVLVLGIATLLLAIFRPTPPATLETRKLEFNGPAAARRIEHGNRSPVAQ